MMKSGVYIIENTIDGKVYVGSAVNFSKRWRGHKQDLEKGMHANSRLQNAWKKYHLWDFQFKILIYCNQEFLLLWEQIAIDGHILTIGWDRMYNINPTAGSNFGRRWSKETKEKQSVSHKDKPKPSLRGRKLSDEHKAKIAAHKHTDKQKEKMKAAWDMRKAQGIPAHRQTESAKVKLRNANLGKKASAETKVKMSETHIERCKSPEVRKMLLSISSTSGYKGHAHSKETKLRMSNSQRTSWAKRKMRQ